MKWNEGSGFRYAWDRRHKSPTDVKKKRRKMHPLEKKKEKKTLEI